MNKKTRSVKPPVKKASRKIAPARKARGRGVATLEKRLRAVVGTIDAAHALTAPLVRSIESLLRLAARTVGASDASVLVRDGTRRGGLKFLVATGVVADKLLKIRVPAGKGIAGFVYASGQPMVAADAAQEKSFYLEVDRQTGYSTHTILATPLQSGGRTIGVLEFINRPEGTQHEPFTPREMDLAARFAESIATLVDAHETTGLIGTLFERVTTDAASGEAEAAADVQKWLKSVRAAPEHRELLSLAVALRDIAARGDAERRLCRDILDSLARWTASRHQHRHADSTDMSFFDFSGGEGESQRA